MTLTQPEKLILLMLANIQKKLEIDEETSDLIISSIYSDNSWALTWEFKGKIGGEFEELPQYVKETANYLDMWSMIESSIERLSAPEKQAVADCCNNRISFIGFDGNNENDHYSAACHFVQIIGSWQEFAKRDLNSHHATLNRASRMFSKFEPIRNKSHDGILNKDQLVAILTD